jgi:hypothetical protein
MPAETENEPLRTRLSDQLAGAGYLLPDRIVEFGSELGGE